MYKEIFLSKKDMSTDAEFCENFVNALFTELQFLGPSHVVLLRVVFAEVLNQEPRPQNPIQMLESVLGWVLINSDDISTLSRYPILKRWWDVPSRTMPPEAFGYGHQPPRPSHVYDCGGGPGGFFSGACGGGVCPTGGCEGGVCPSSGCEGGVCPTGGCEGGVCPSSGCEGGVCPASGCEGSNILVSCEGGVCPKTGCEGGVCDVDVCLSNLTLRTKK